LLSEGEQTGEDIHGEDPLEQPFTMSMFLHAQNEHSQQLGVAAGSDLTSRLL